MNIFWTGSEIGCLLSGLKQIADGIADFEKADNNASVSIYN